MTWNVLFLCTGNSARSILAEALLNRHGAARFRGYSAGSHPKGEIHPVAIEVLREQGHATDDLRSKSWDEFAAPAAPRLDLVLTVCDAAAREACPIWPGGPTAAHWGMEDPAAVIGSADKQRAAFHRTYTELERRIRLLTSLNPESLERESLKAKLAELGAAEQTKGGVVSGI
jgi:arsenate reductase